MCYAYLLIYINLYEQLYKINYIAHIYGGKRDQSEVSETRSWTYRVCKNTHYAVTATRRYSPVGYRLLFSATLRRKRTTPVREKRHDYIFSPGINPPYGCLRVCLPSCRAAAFYIRVWNQYRVATRTPLDFFPSLGRQVCMCV